MSKQKTKKQKVLKSLDFFHSSCSKFREAEEKTLNIKIRETSNLETIFLKEYHDIEVNERLEGLLLPEFDEGKVHAYAPSKDDGLNTFQRKFLIKLKLVLANNNPDVEVEQCERFIDDLITFVCELADLDDGLYLTLRPCNLRLIIGDESFGSIADKEGRKGMDLVWLITEDKHKKSKTYKHGDLQIACSMLAAFQKNYNLTEQVLPTKIIGLKLVAHEINFCSMCLTREYIEEIYEGRLPLTNECLMYKLESLSFSSPEDRKLIMKYLTILRSEVLGLQNFSEA